MTTGGRTSQASRRLGCLAALALALAGCGGTTHLSRADEGRVLEIKVQLLGSQRPPPTAEEATREMKVVGSGVPWLIRLCRRDRNAVDSEGTSVKQLLDENLATLRAQGTDALFTEEREELALAVQQNCA